MTEDLNTIPRHIIEAFDKIGPEQLAWQLRAGTLSAPRRTYATRWLAHRDRARQQARKRRENMMFYLAVATAVLAFVAAAEGALQLLLTAR